MTNEDEEYKKYKEYKQEIERDGPNGLLARLQSGLISLPYKQRAANRALRENAEDRQREVEARQEAREIEHLRAAHEANKIAKSGTVPGWLQITGIIATIILTGLGVYLTWIGVTLDLLKLIIGQ